MITLQTIGTPNLTTTVIAQREVKPSELKNSAIIASLAAQDKLLTLRPANANNQFSKEQDANAMSNTMILVMHVSLVHKATCLDTLMEQSLKPIKMKHQDAKDSCHGKSTLTQMLTNKPELIIREMVSHLMRKLNMTAMLKIHTSVLNKIAIDATHVELTKLLTEPTTDVHK
jgi:hypothetical protein